ncbi:ribosome-assembly protein 3-domain-containing protein [Apiosordaria backusii]|uniref:Ribosome assembly protein 3 n=1 Tax=Apiosordaria backusii TaxID=314023 RepID=A0AA40DV47_9PEZI|nr:ribosome-assembly protein 3-domain-containing protein [Apiosordaria backusii]
MSSPEPQQQQQKSQKQVDAEFTSYYLQRATQEFGEALDAVRSADDFKPESSIAVLISALQQGTEMFSEEDKRAVVCSEGAEKSSK